MTRIRQNCSYTKPSTDAVRPKERKCLRCRRNFKSPGIHYQLCKNCRYSIKKANLDCEFEAASCNTNYDMTMTISDLPIL